jgi:hypothetical protein
MKAFLLLLILHFPFCMDAQLSMHSRGAAMGDAGIAAAKDNQSLGYNVGKTVFNQYFHQASLTYLPWMRRLFSDTKFIRADYLSTIGESATLGVAVDYLDMGNLTARDDNGASLAIYRNTAFGLGGSVGVRLSAHTGMGATLRLCGARGFGSGPVQQYGMNGDIHFYQSLGKISLGAVLNHLGNAVWRTTEMGLGLAYSDHDETKEWTIGLDMKKPWKGSFAATRFSLGGELGWQESFFIRAGFQLEGLEGGNRQWMALGAGYKGFVEDQSWSIDLHYQIPFRSKAAIAPLQHAYGLSLNLNLGNF